MPEKQSKFTLQQILYRIVIFSFIFFLIFFGFKHSVRLYAHYRVIWESLPEQYDKLRALHTPLGFPKRGDWLESQVEWGQTFDEYVGLAPVRPSSKLTKIYIQPLGPFANKHKSISEILVEYMQIFFCTETVLNQPVSLSELPAEARREHPETGTQYNTGYVNNKLLIKNRPDDALAYLGLTYFDLWPGRDWNFVFGQATLRDRVGVWSLNRFGDPYKSDVEFNKVLKRALRTASHETGHILGIHHCTTYSCNMNGSNSLQEADRRPLYLCPHCLYKLIWNTECDMQDRFEQLLLFASQYGFKTEQEYYSRVK